MKGPNCSTGMWEYVNQNLVEIQLLFVVLSEMVGGITGGHWSPWSNVASLA